jgi:UDP-N-acetylglucosamine 4,6-dehydratase/5-epimerase
MKPQEMLNGQAILITGGTGSFGQRFVQTLLEEYNPRKVIVFSRDELKQYEMQQKWPSDDVMRYWIGDVRDRDRIRFAIHEDVDYVVHAAALKQVPASEYNPFEAVKTNVIGAQNIIDSALKSDIKGVIALSTDKAVVPVNLYGATKLVSDRLFVAANNYRNRDVRFSVVRYGNVMSSRGSVVPLFKKQKEKGILSITDDRMTRFNITLKEGVNFVLQCFPRMLGGEIFIPRIPSYRITDLAQAIAPDCEHRVVGIRPGEKLHEELINEADSRNTIEFADYFVGLPNSDSLPLHDERLLTSQHGQKGKHCLEGFSYGSDTNERFLTVDELRQLIKTQI